MDPVRAPHGAFPNHGREEVVALELGDELVHVYDARGAYRNPTRDRGRVIGIATVSTKVERLAEPVRFGERKFPDGCALDLGPVDHVGDGVEIVQLRGDLAAFQNAWCGLVGPTS